MLTVGPIIGGHTDVWTSRRRPVRGGGNVDGSLERLGQSRRRSRWLAPAALLGVVALIAGACGGATQQRQAASTIEYAIWGDPAELASQQAIVDAFHAANPNVKVKVTVLGLGRYWTSCRPASPAAPRRTCSRWTARSSPTTRPATCCWT